MKPMSNDRLRLAAAVGLIILLVGALMGLANDAIALTLAAFVLGVVVAHVTERTR